MHGMSQRYTRYNGLLKNFDFLLIFSLASRSCLSFVQSLISLISPVFSMNRGPTLRFAYCPDELDWSFQSVLIR